MMSEGCTYGAMAGHDTTHAAFAGYDDGNRRSAHLGGQA